MSNATEITATATMKPEITQAMIEITQGSIYLMGISFVLGSLFTIFLLLVLDFIRSLKDGDKNQ